GYPPHPDLLTGLAKHAADMPLAGYGDIEGEQSLREAFARHTSSQLDATLTLDNIQITAGCNQAFVVAMLALAAPGDRVLLTNPCFFNNESSLRMLGLEPRFVECHASDRFAPNPAAVAEQIDRENIRVVALISPNNPTGAIYSPDTLCRIQNACRENGTWLVIDETYADFIGETPSPRHDLLTTSGWENNTVLLYSFSKVYCMPGLRVGAITGSTDVIAQTTKVMDNLQICAPRHAQTMLADAIPSLAGWRQSNTTEIARRAAAFRNAIADADGWEIASLGAYFAYVRHPFTGQSSQIVAERLAREAGVLCLPGTFFGTGQERYLRIAFANADVGEIGHLSARLNTMT
ncbi:MAG: aminotransferase, partial [Methyloligellaceae bacterium]